MKKVICALASMSALTLAIPVYNKHSDYTLYAYEGLNSIMDSIVIADGDH